MTAAARPNYSPPHKFSAEGRIAATSNRALKDMRVPWSLPILETDDIIGTALVEFSRGTVVVTDPTAGGQWDDSAAAAAKFTNDLTDITDAGTQDIPAFPTSELAGDKLVIGSPETGGVPAGCSVTDATGNGAGGTVVWRYLSKQGTWKTFNTVRDNTVSLTATGGIVNWEIPDDWVPMIETEVDTVARYYFAAEVVTVYATNPTIDQLEVHCLLPGNMSLAFAAPSTGLITHLSYVATASASNNDTILQVLNWTRGTRGLVTMTQAIVAARVALSTQLFVEQEDELTIQALQIDGTTEFTNFAELALHYQP